MKTFTLMSVLLLHLFQCEKSFSSFTPTRNWLKSQDSFNRKSQDLVTSFSSNETVYNRNSKFFPYFLIQFPNEPCTGPGNEGGVCVSSKECRQAGGSVMGVCAQGFGTCCRYKRMCGKDGGDVQVRENSTDIISLSKSFSCRYILSKTRGLCQVRLDFNEFNFGQALPNGQCSSTKLEIKGSVKDMHLCGNLTGQHLYLNFGTSDKIFINAAESNSSVSVYSIRVSFFKCSSQQIVPSHCTQFYSRTSGRIRSFNWPQQQLNNQDYTICVASPEVISGRKGRQIFQRIHWSPCNTTTGASTSNEGKNPMNFFISGKRDDLPVTDARQCDTDFIQIFGGNRQCGNKFQNETISSLPYLLRVKFDERETDETMQELLNVVSVSKPREGCESLNTKSVKCVPESNANLPTNNHIQAATVDGGLCQCSTVQSNISTKKKVDVGNTGFCLSYQIVTGFERY